MSIDKKSSYYDAGGIETINILRAKLTPEQFKGYLLGNILKYSCRLNFKNDDNGKRDVEKIGHYINLLKDVTLETEFVPIPVKKVILDLDKHKIQQFLCLLNAYFGKEIVVKEIMTIFDTVFIKET